MKPDGTLLIGLALGALTILGGYLLLIGLVFVAIPVYDSLSKRQYLDAFVPVVMYLVFVALECALARKTVRTLKRWRQRP